MTIKSTIKSTISKLAGNTAATNEAYIQYEKASQKSIIQRNSNGDPIVQKNGYYQLNEYGNSQKTSSIDAFRHAYTSAKTARDYGEGLAHFLGDAWERAGEDKTESNMDFWNNSGGRKYNNELGPNATNDQIGSRVYMGTQNNELILNKNDPREYNSGSWLDSYGPPKPDELHIWSKAEWASGQINNNSYNKSNPSSTKLNFQLSNPMEDAIKYLGSALNHLSPLVLDLDGDGIETAGINDGNVFFDIKNTGFVNKVGWIKGDDGLLALDRDGNSQIDNITELFGDYRQGAWDELRLLDSNNNNKIDAGDQQFANLKIWQDKNQNGISEEGELKSLSEFNIKEISLNNQALNTYQNENYISSKGSITYNDGSIKQNIYDVHFLNDNANTWYKGAQSEQFGNDFEIKVEALLLPLSRGYGDLPSLHIALSLDETLLQMLTEFATLDKSQLNEIPQRLENILYRWAGVDSVDPDSVAEGNGSNIDARKLRFVEKFSGLTWEQLGMKNIVGQFAALDIKKAWDGIFNETLTRLSVQGPLQEIFTEATYDFAADNILLNIDYQTIINRVAEFDLKTTDFAMQIAHIIYSNKNELNIDFARINQDFKNIFGQDFKLSDETIKINWGTERYYDDLEKGSIQAVDDNNVLKYNGSDTSETINASNIGDYIFAKGGNDTINGSSNEDYIDGGAGNDTLIGNADNDWLVGGEGDDILYGNDGHDRLNGGLGNDKLYGGAQDDRLEGGAGADYIDGGDGIDGATYIDSLKGVNINLKTGAASGGDADGDTILSIENIQGSQFNDILTGNDNNNVIHGEFGNNIIYAQNGDDIIFAAGGASQYYGEAGSDNLKAWDGYDLMDGGEGEDQVDYHRPDINSKLEINLKTGITTYLDKTANVRYIVPKDKYNDYSNGKFAAIKTSDVEISFNIASDANYYNDYLEIKEKATTEKVIDTLRSIENVGAGYLNDKITGDDNNNIIFAYEGNDTILGEGGNDYLKDGIGNDRLTGGAGQDSFYITQEINARDTMTDFDVSNEKIILEEFNSQFKNFAELRKNITQSGSSTIINFGDNQRLTLENVVAKDLSYKNFVGNTSINSAPTIFNFAEKSEEKFMFFDVLKFASDVDGDQLRIGQVNTPQNGQAEIVDGKIKYTPNDGFVGTEEFLYSIVDAGGKSTVAKITVEVGPINDTPVLAYNPENQVANLIEEFKFQFRDDLFTDEEGDQLTYTATLQSGQPLPDWLKFDAATRTFSGTPTVNDQDIRVVLEASDGNSSRSTSFEIKIQKEERIFEGAEEFINNSQKISNDNANKILVTDFDGDGSQDVMASFADKGLWIYKQNKGWNQISKDEVKDFKVTDFDGDGKNDIISSFANGTLVKYNQASDKWDFTFLTIESGANNASIEDFKTIDIDGDGKQDLLSDLQTAGLWRYLQGNNTNFKLSDTNFTNFKIYDYDNDGRQDVIFNLKGNGFYYYSPAKNIFGAFLQSATDNFEIGDFNGDGLADLAYINPSFGLVYNDHLKNSMTFIGFQTNVKSFAVADFNNDGKSELLINQNDILWHYDPHKSSGQKTQLSNLFIKNFKIVDFNGDGKQDILIDSGNSLWIYDSASKIETKIFDGVAEDFYIISEAGQDGNRKLVIDLGDNGLWIKNTTDLSNETINGSQSHDQIRAKNGNDIINANGGNDTVYAGAGNDIINGGDGDDILYGESGIDTISGGAGNDTILVDADLDTINGDAGNDLFIVNQDSQGLINDFEAVNKQEKIDLTAFKNIRDISDIKFENYTENGQLITKILLSNAQNYLILNNVDKNQLTNDNFIFFDDQKPTAAIDQFTTQEDQPIQFTLDQILQNDSDQEDGAPQFDKILSMPQFGILEISPDGLSYNYKPNANFNGSDSFEYQIIDSNGATSKGVVTFNVEAVNDDPYFISQPHETTLYEDSTSLIDILANVADIDGGKFNIIINSAPSNGVVEIVRNDSGYQKIQYKPNANFNGADQFEYSVVDENGATITKKLDIIVNSLNDAPIISLQPQYQQTKQGFSISLENLISDVDGDVLTINLKQSNGDALPAWLKFDAATKILRFLPIDYNFADQISLSLTVSDSQNQTKQDFVLKFDRNLKNPITLENDTNDFVKSTIYNDIITGSVDDETISLVADGNFGKDKQMFDTKSANIGLVNLANKNFFNDTISDNQGVDTVSLTIENDAFIFDDNSTLSIAGIEKISSGSGGDLILLNTNRMTNGIVIDSGTGNDIIVATKYNDEILAGTGNDIIDAGDGDDKITGGSGNDRIYGGQGADNIQGNDGNDKIYGGSENDIITGGFGNDEIFGEAGNDRIDGGTGIDKINGGLGADRLTGGADGDIFIFSNFSDSSVFATDLIVDFVQGQDKIDISDLGYNQALTEGLFSAENIENTLEFSYFKNSGSSGVIVNTIVRDPHSDFTIRFAGEIKLTVEDFIF